MVHKQTQLQLKRRIAVGAVIATVLLGVGMPAANAHTASLTASGACQDDGTRLVTYTGKTQNVPSHGDGQVATLTVTGIAPTGTSVSPSTQTVTGNTTYTFTQTISGSATTAKTTAHLVWGDRVTSDAAGQATFTENCQPVVPREPAPLVQVTHSDTTDCDAEEVTTTTVTTTTGWGLKDNIWVKTTPVVKRKITTRDATDQECPIVVLGASAVVPAIAAPVQAAAANPLPVSAAAGEVSTSGQLYAGGLTAFAAFLALGAGFLLRRRHGEV